MKDKIYNIVNKLENSPKSFNKFIISFGAIVVIRLYIEGLLLGLPQSEFIYFALFFVHTLLFFGLIFLVFLWLIKKITGQSYGKIASVLLWGYWFMILPPIIDKIIFGNKLVWSYYLFDGLGGLGVRFLTFFGSNPDSGITYGTRVVIATVTLFLSFYIYLKTKKVIYFFLSIILSYFIFFIFSSFPCWITFFLEIINGKNIEEVTNLDVARVFLSPFDYFNVKLKIELFLIYRLTLLYNLFCFVSFFAFLAFNYKGKFISLIKNVRFPQVIFNFGLLFIGMGLGYYYFPRNNFDFFYILIVVNLLVMVFSSWFFSVFINDITDQRVDRKSNPDRPLIKSIFSINEYKNFSKIFLFFSLTSALLVGFQAFSLIIVYHFLTWIYSHYPFRLKRYYPISAILSSFASLIFLIVGFLIFSENQTLGEFPWKVFFFLLVAFSLILPIKDFKDVKYDKKDGVYTLPVILGLKNTKFFLAIALFFLYLFSVILLREPRLFLAALIFGCINFWALISDKFDNRKIIWPVLFLVFLYAIFLVGIIFLSFGK